MNEADLKSIWHSYDKKIEKILQINVQQLHAIQTQHQSMSLLVIPMGVAAGRLGGFQQTKKLLSQPQL